MLYTQVIVGATQYVALGKHEPFIREWLTVAGAIVGEPSALCFEFGDTAEKALRKLKESMQESEAVNGKTKEG